MLKNVLLSAVVFGLCLVGLEVGARLVESWAREQSDPGAAGKSWQLTLFRQFGGLHQSDPELLWRHRANLPDPFRTNSQHFLGPELEPGDPASTYRILVLGDSTPVGIGMHHREDAFGEVLGGMLEADLAAIGQRVEVVNAAVSGYTSEQVAAFLATRGFALEPDLVIVYCGNNDASISGPLSDDALMRRQQLGGFGPLLSRLALYRVIATFKSSLDDRPGGAAPLVVRVPPHRYGENLERMIDEARARDVPIVVVKPTVPMLWPAGLQFKWLHELREEGQLVFPVQMQRILGRQIKYALDYERMHRNYGGTWSADTVAVYDSAYVGPPEEKDAIAYYTRLRQRSPNDSVIRNDLGVSLWQGGRLEDADRELRAAVELYRRLHASDAGPASVGAGAAFLFNLGINTLTRSEQPDAEPRLAVEAWQILDQALQADYFSLRVKRPYLEQIERIEEGPGVMVVDGPAIFEAAGREQLFVDHCHPTATGHRLIASAIRERVLDTALEAGRSRGAGRLTRPAPGG